MSISMGIGLGMTVLTLGLVQSVHGADGSETLRMNFKNPEMVQAVRAGKNTTANAAWWGFDEKDSTQALQGAINSGARKVIVPFMGKDWVVGPLTLASNLELIFEPGVVVAAKKGLFKGRTDCLFQGNRLRNISLTGYGAVLKMQKKDYVGPDYAKAEWRNVFEFNSCENIKILGLTVADSGGDGIYLGQNDPAHPMCKDILIKDVTFDNNHRQGISVISAENLMIENCTFKNTRGTSPAAGIDFEPNSPKEQCTNCVIQNCIFDANKGPGIQIFLVNLTSKSSPVSITVTDCLVKNNDGPGLWVGGVRNDGPKGGIEFVNCTVRENRRAGAYFRDKSPRSVPVRFVKCVWSNVATDASGSNPIMIEGTAEGIKVLSIKTAGGIEFVDCYLFDQSNRPLLTVGKLVKGLEDIKGTLYVWKDPADQDNETLKKAGVSLKRIERSLSKR